MSQRYSGGIITANPTTPTTTSASGVWTLEQQFQNSANWPKTAEPVSRSVRFRSSATASLSRTFIAGDRTKFTWSGWVKRGALTGNQNLFGPYTNSTGSGTYGVLRFVDGAIEAFDYTNGTSNWYMATTSLHRDPAAWYHIQLAVDTTQATSSNRVKLYVNGVQLTAFTTATYPSASYQGQWNNALVNYIGYTPVASQYFDGYLAEVNYIDGQALDPSYFGFTDVNGVWQPAAYSGSYGTNGFYLNFSDNSGVTATTIGKDYSGNGNNWTPNNISVTAGTTYDSMLDVPTNYSDGGNGRGNYPVWNPIKKVTANLTITDGNLTASDSSASATQAFATMFLPPTGKWYWEVNNVAGSGLTNVIGVVTEAIAQGNSVNSVGFYRSNGQIQNLSSVNQTSGATYTAGDVIGVAVDVDAGTVQFYKNGAAQGATPSFTFTAGSVLVPMLSTDNSAGTKTFAGNFGQRPFNSTPPTGFIALNTQNLSGVTINKGNQYFDATLWSGNSSSQTVVNSGGFQPDLVWVKSRSGAYDHMLYDAIRGANINLRSNTTAAEVAGSPSEFTSFNSNGFTVASNGTQTNVNISGATYVGWQWNAGGSTVSNTNGSITSSVRANPTAGFSIVTYTGTGANATVGHGLGVAPSMIIVKSRSTAATNWVTYHTILGATKYILLNTTGAVVTDSTPWNNTAPTSSVLSLGTSSNTNGNTSTFVAYCFAAVAGYSAFGSYTGNGSTDGPFVYCGFKPRFIMVKRTDAGGSWDVHDTARDTYNAAPTFSQANSTAAEYTVGALDINSNGFKLRTTDVDHNASAATYIFMAFAENPFKLSRAR